METNEIKQYFFILVLFRITYSCTIIRGQQYSKTCSSSLLLSPANLSATSTLSQEQEEATSAEMTIRYFSELDMFLNYYEDYSSESLSVKNTA